MKMGKSWILTSCMLLMIAAGAVMPRIVSALQDRSLELQADSRELQEIRLELQMGAFLEKGLNLLTSGYTRIEWSGMTQRTVQEAQSAAEEVYAQLLKKGLVPEVMAEEVQLTAQPFLAVSAADGQDPAVVWKCVWSVQERMVGTLILDDATGKMIGLTALKTTTSTVYMEKPQEKQAAQAAQWAEFCRDYYGFDSAAIETGRKDARDIFTLQLLGTVDGEEVVCRLPLILCENSISFNSFDL